MSGLADANASQLNSITQGIQNLPNSYAQGRNQRLQQELGQQQLAITAVTAQHAEKQQAMKEAIEYVNILKPAFEAAARSGEGQAAVNELQQKVAAMPGPSQAFQRAGMDVGAFKFLVKGGKITATTFPVDVTPELAAKIKKDQGLTVAPGTRVNVTTDENGKTTYDDTAFREEQSKKVDQELRRDNITSQIAGREAASAAAAGKAEKGKTIPESSVSKLTDLENSLNLLKEAPEYLKNISPYTGPGASVFATSPWASDTKQAQGHIGMVVQNVAKALEGGKLSNEDVVRYTRILLNPNSLPKDINLAAARIQKALVSQYDTRLSTLKKAGYDVSGFTPLQADLSGFLPKDKKAEVDQRPKKPFNPKNAVPGDVVTFADGVTRRFRNGDPYNISGNWEVVK